MNVRRDANIGGFTSDKEAPSAGFGDPGWTEQTWLGAEPEPAPPKSILAHGRGAARLALFVLATLILLPPFFAARALGGRRDRSVAALWCGIGVRLCGLKLRIEGRPLSEGGAILSNHCSWIDILTIGATAPVHFVAKAEVAGWPLFGWIGKISNTVFIERRRTEARIQERQLVARATAGDLLCLFPEGTSTDGLRVAPFKSSLFAMFFSDAATAQGLSAQPVTVHYAPRAGLAPSFYGWWGRMGLFGHLWDIVCLSRGGVATVIFHPAILVAADRSGGRKALAAEVEAAVESGRARLAAALDDRA